MKRFAVILVVLLVAGCSRHESSWVTAASRVKLPSSALDQSRLLSYAQSPAFAKRMKAEAATNGWGQVTIVVERPDSGFLEFKAASTDTQTAVQVASLMASQLMAFAIAHKMDEAQLDRTAAVLTR